MFVPITEIKKEIVKDVEVYNFSVVEDESYVSHGIVVHNCTAPVYSSDSLHSAVVELIAMEGSRIQYTTIQNWSNNVYNLVTKRAFAYKNATVFWVDGNLGCLAEGTKISTNPGLKPIEKILSGEKVITLNEQTNKLEAKKVLATKFSGVQETYKLVLENGKREVIATKNHPFLALQYDAKRPRKSGRYTSRWLPLGDLSEGSYLIVPKELPDFGVNYKFKKPLMNRVIKGRNQYGAEYDINTSYKYKNIKMPEISNEEVLWLFGFSIGDGNIEITKNKKTGKDRFGKIIFSVPDGDPARGKVKDIMKVIFNLDYFYERSDKISISYNSLVVAEFFKLNGVDGNAHTKRVPEWVFGIPLNQKKAFLAGYMEADGMIIKNCARLKTCNKALLEDLKNLAISCGVEVNKIEKHTEIKKINVKEKYNYKEKEYTNYVMHISNLIKLRAYFSEKNREKIPKKMFEHSTYWLTETRRIKMHNHLALYKITNISPLGEKPTYDLEIEGSHNFVANGIIVHNSKITMKYPSIYLLGEGAKAEILSVAFAGKGQHQDAGGKILHFAPNTTSRITSKSVSKDGGRTTYRGLLKVAEGCHNVKSHVSCDALILDEHSASDTVPYMEINEKNVNIEHEATVGKIGEEQLFYLMSRGLSQDQAMTMIVSGFMEPFTKELPLEYAIELNRLIALNMEGSVG
ncbi:SufD family Fe-S cluster assembly protein [Candidatus Woesearchaeota archaeon]|nr:SufD family Fe-S cluster assembly protein [Candidatus Woesearchaeota archaeon]